MRFIPRRTVPEVLPSKSMTTHPEDARLSAAKPLDVTLYSRPGCHLCEEAKAAIEPLLREFGANLHEVNINEDKILMERYAFDIPVLFLGQRKVAKHHVNPPQFRRQLQNAKERV